MRRLVAARLPVTAVWLTRGGLHGDRREAESRQAMELIGLDPREQIFFRLPDGQVLDFMDEIVERLARLFGKVRPASIFVPAFEGGHPDHDAAQLAAAAALKRAGGNRVVAALNQAGGKRVVEGSGSGSGYSKGAITGEREHRQQPRLYEFPLYHRANTKLLKVGEFIPATAPVERTPMKLKDRLLKRKLAAVFSSQRLIIRPLIGLRGGSMMVHLKGEPYRAVSRDRDYTVRPHPGRLAYEYYTPKRFHEFSDAAKSVKS
jgi:LmbE family N-acetylglucosaminyl deacetylase